MRRGRGCLLWAALLALGAACPALATTKGLNQVITPDLQPAGQLSLSYQQQDSGIGNPSELQLELGLTPCAEIAVFQGFEPGETILAAEVGTKRGPWLLATGFANWTLSAEGDTNPQPFAEVGYYRGPHKAIVGATWVEGQVQTILGYAYAMTPTLQWQADYQSGSGNSSTFGFTYGITPNLSLNPAVYFPNDAPHRAEWYGVLSWNVTVF